MVMEFLVFALLQSLIYSFLLGMLLETIICITDYFFSA